VHERHDRRDDGDLVERDRDGGLSPSLIALVVVVVLAVVFIIQNQNDARIEFLFWTVDTAVWVAIAVALVLGAILGWLLLAMARRRRRR
jgi:uncharacterized integral membrane protein